MGELLSPARLKREVEELSQGKHLVNPVQMIRDALGLFRPATRITTLECAEKYRSLRTTEGGALVRYDRKRTPYNIAKMDALDDPNVNLVVFVKPSRSGGTAVVENYLFKIILFGPMGDVGWYLGSDDAVKQYAERVIKPMFEDHPDLQAKIGKGRSDNNEASKRIAGHLVEWMAAKDANFRNREFVFGVMDEPDGWTKFSESPETQLIGRQKNVGRRRKGAILSHPDKGWGAGAASVWTTSSRGIYIMRCVECEMFASAHSTKFWPEVPEFKLHYQRAPNASSDERLAMAESTAGMLCPHCGSVLDDTQRFAMVEEAGESGWWLHRGQTFDPVDGISGEMDHTGKVGFYDHGLMLKTSASADLARGLEEVLIKYERSRGSRIATKALREFMSKQLGEIFEGKKDIEGVSAASLQKRARTEAQGDEITMPSGALFITCAVDVAPGKFDISFRAWDMENRSWWLDRLTIRQRRWEDGRMRDIRTRERIEDWDVLIDEAILRSFPIEGKTGWTMPVAQVVIDVGDGNVTWMGREFAARCFKRGLFWGGGASKWPRVQLLQGSASRTAPELPPKPRLQDDKGKRFPAGAREWTLGVHKLKELALERLAVTDGGPGQCYFAPHIADNYFEEYFNEPLIDGKFDRQGPNESLDLFGYEEAARLMLKPDRKDIDWSNLDKRPPWARPVSLKPKGGDPAETGAGDAGRAVSPEKKPSLLDQFSALNNGGRTR